MSTTTPIMTDWLECVVVGWYVTRRPIKVHKLLLDGSGRIAGVENSAVGWLAG